MYINRFEDGNVSDTCVLMVDDEYMEDGALLNMFVLLTVR